MRVGALSSQKIATKSQSSKALAQRRRGTIWALISIIFSTWLCVTSDAAAQNCTITAEAANRGAGVTATSVAVAANIAADVTAANTAFLTQSTVFVGASGNQQSDQPGGGVWSRAVGG